MKHLISVAITLCSKILIQYFAIWSFDGDTSFDSTVSIKVLLIFHRQKRKILAMSYCWTSKKHCYVAIGRRTFSISITINFCATVKFLTWTWSEAIRASIGAASSLSLFNISHVYQHLVVTYWISFFGTSLGLIVLCIANSLSDAYVDEIKCSISDHANFI